MHSLHCWRALLASAAGPLLATVAALAPPSAVGAQENDEILARMEFDRLRTYSGPGVNLASLLQRAHAEKLLMPTLGGTLKGLVDTEWESLGPEQVDDGSRITAGRVSVIVIHPDDTDVLFAGGAQGGVWKSTDVGESWEPLTDGECSLAMGHIAIDPEDPDIIYAGTGEQHFSGDSYYGCGMLRTLDGGETWEQQGADVFVEARRGSGSGGARIARVVIDRATAGSSSETIVMAASTYGLYRSENSGGEWEEVISGTATDLLAHPEDDSVFFAAIHGSGVYRSVDTGETWESASSGMSFGNARRINLAIAPSNPDVLYASFQTTGSEGSGLRMYRTDDGGDEWERLDATGASCWYQCWYDMTIAVDPEDEETVYFGSLRLYRSEDGGDTFSQHHNSGVYVDEHYLRFDGDSVLYLANDGGVYRSTDGADSWTSLANGLVVAQYYRGIALHPSDPAVTLGGTQDQGTQRSEAGTKVWEKVMGGDGGYTAFDVEDPETWYAETQWIRNSGYSGPRKNGRLVVSGIDRGESGLFIPPLVMDPMESKRLYFGVRSLYRTDDSAESWQRIYRSPGGVVSAVGLTPADEDAIYVALLSGRVVVTRDGGDSWQSSGSGLPNRFIGDVAVHPEDPDQAYAVAGGFLTGHVFHTTDGGRTWQDRTGNLPDHPVNAIVYDPSDYGAVVIGTDLGVFYAASGGDDWLRLDDGLPTVAVFDLATQPGTSRLVAATHGRGMFELEVDVPLKLWTRPGAISDTVIAGDTIGKARQSGEIIAAPRGKEDHSTTWEAESDEEWIELDSATGEGRGRFDYKLTGRGLEAGDHEAAIEVTLEGVGETFEVPVSVTALSPSHLEVGPGPPPVKLPEGSTEAVGDSVPVSFTGPRQETAWSAERSGGGDWFELATASGEGPGFVTWTVDPTGLEVGLYVDTITVEAYWATGSPAAFVDTFAVQEELEIEEERESSGYAVAGWTLSLADSLPSGISGYGEDDAVWEAEATSSGWLELERSEGGFRDHIVWRRNAEELEAGVYEGEITIKVRGYPDLVGTITDSLEVVEETAVEDAARHLMGESRLGSGQLEFLDWFGNGDGSFNLGDVLRWIDHCGGGGDDIGCGDGNGEEAIRGAIHRLRLQASGALAPPSDRPRRHQ